MMLVCAAVDTRGQTKTYCTIPERILDIKIARITGHTSGRLFEDVDPLSDLRDHIIDVRERGAKLVLLEKYELLFCGVSPRLLTRD